MSELKRSNIHFIASNKVLSKTLAEILKDNVDVVGIDIESNSMYKYFENICLIQLAVKDQVYLIDLPRTGIVDELKELLLAENIVKVFQDMQYDLSIIFKEFGIKPVNIYDISIADRLIQHRGNNHNLEKIVKDYLNISIKPKKSLQKSNWSVRPLSESQILYASEDVYFLPELYKITKKILNVDFRLACFYELMKNIPMIDNSRKYNILSMWKIRGIERLENEQLLKLEALLLFRNHKAKEINKPIHWIFSDLTAIDMVRGHNNSVLQLKNHLKKKKRLTKFTNLYINDIYSVLNQDYSNGRKLKVPDLGISLRTWVPIHERPTLKYGSILKSKAVKEWIRIVVENCQIIPDFISNKYTFADLSYYSVEELMKKHENNEIIFLGIINIFVNVFLRDLAEYLSNGSSTINYDILNKIYIKKFPRDSEDL